MKETIWIASSLFHVVASLTGLRPAPSLMYCTGTDGKRVDGYLVRTEEVPTLKELLELEGISYEAWPLPGRCKAWT